MSLIQKAKCVAGIHHWTCRAYDAGTQAVGAVWTCAGCGKTVRQWKRPS